MRRQDNPPAPRQGASTASRSARRALRLAPFLVVFWLLLSGRIEPLPLALGALAVAVVCWVSWRADIEHQGLTLSFMLRLPRLFLWLGAKVLTSAFAVVRKVWSPRPDLRPVVAATPAAHLPELSQVVYANAITLTPGTLSLYVTNDHIDVHALAAGGIDELRAGAMLQQIRRTEVTR